MPAGSHPKVRTAIYQTTRTSLSLSILKAKTLRNLGIHRRHQTSDRRPLNLCPATAPPSGGRCHRAGEPSKTHTVSLCSSDSSGRQASQVRRCLDHVGKEHGASNQTDESWPGATSFWPAIVQIDHIFGRGVRFHSAWVPSGGGSDHQPIVARLHLEARNLKTQWTNESIQP